MLILFLSFSLEENLTNSVELIPPSALAEDSNWLKISAHLWLKKKSWFRNGHKFSATREVNPKTCTEAIERVPPYPWIIIYKLNES